MQSFIIKERDNSSFDWKGDQKSRDMKEARLRSLIKNYFKNSLMLSYIANTYIHGHSFES